MGDYEGGPWGIVIVISAFMIQFLTFGVSGCIGVYNIEFLEHFQASAAQVSLVVALHFGAFLGSGPIVSFLMAKFSHRKTVMGGSVLVVLGLLAVPLFPNLYMLYLTIGVLVGFGSCCAYIPSHTLCGFYYDKYRSLATGIASSGGGLGYAVMPIFVAHFIETYTWTRSFIILAGFCLHVFVFGALLRSPPELQEKSEVVQKDDYNLPLNIGDNDNVENEFDLYVERVSDDDYTPEDFKLRAEVISVENKCLQSRQSGYKYDHCETENEAVLNGQLKINNEEDEELPDTARHIYIFKDYNFVVYFITNYLWNAAGVMSAAFLPQYFSIRGCSLEEISWLVGASGFGSCLGGLLGGSIGNTKCVNRIYLFILSCCLVGLFLLLTPSGQGVSHFAATQFLGGLSYGVLLGLLAVVLADLVGIKSLGNGMGFVMLANGLGTFTGPIFGGILIDYTGSEESGIYMAGIFSVVSGVFMCLIPLRQFFNRL